MPNEEQVGVTLSLPMDIISKIDAIAKNSLLVSRSRVIQSVVDEVIAVREIVEERPKPLTPQDAQSLAEAISKGGSAGIAIALDIVTAIAEAGTVLDDINRRVSKFNPGTGPEVPAAPKPPR